MAARNAVESTSLKLPTPSAHPKDPATAAIIIPAQTPDRTLGASPDPLTTASLL